MMRASTSRPISSVPNQCARLGGLRTSDQFVAIGSYGLISGAKTAMAMKNSTTTAPTMAPRRLTRRRTARRQGCDSGGAAAVVSMVVAVMTVSRAQARVDEEIGEVGEQVEQDIRGRGEEHDALHHGIVAVEHGIDDELAETGDGEDLLGQDGAGEQLAEFERAERDDGNQRVAQPML